jgi:ABC-type transporter Mla maintaining outer membrane lipid asymmetry ATPase subunit MlaF
VFKTEGLPEFTFVPPPNYNEILLDVRHATKPVILEGQSGTGKTTCVRHILAELNPEQKPEYLTARNPTHVSKIEKVIREQIPGQFVIDDFHRVGEQLQEEIADVAKLSADLGSDGKLPKLIVIGINQIGSDLIQLVPDIAKRTGIHRIAPGERLTSTS